MYQAYFVNTFTGKLLITSTPKDNPHCNPVTGWRRITEEAYLLFKLVILANKNNEE